MKERNKAGTPKAARPEDAKPATDGEVQGEGDYAADRRYRERTDRFLERADVEEIAREAAPNSPDEAREMQEAEREGRSHAHLPPKRAEVPDDAPPGGKRGR